MSTEPSTLYLPLKLEIADSADLDQPVRWSYDCFHCLTHWIKLINFNFTCEGNYREHLMNRKLIRPNLGAIKEKLGRNVRQRQTEPKQPGAPAADCHTHHCNGAASGSAQGAFGVKRKTPPPEQTNAENFYYLKQMQAKTPMVIILQDGERIRGLIEWYDKHCIKITCQKEPNILLPKHSIKYMYKQEEEPRGRKLRCAKKDDELEADADATLYD